jgi:hypothetical protein
MFRTRSTSMDAGTSERLYSAKIVLAVLRISSACPPPSLVPSSNADACKIGQFTSSPSHIEFAAVTLSFTYSIAQLLRYHQPSSYRSVRLLFESYFPRRELTVDRAFRWLKDLQAISTTRSTVDEPRNEQQWRYCVTLNCTKNSRRHWSKSLQR